MAQKFKISLIVLLVLSLFSCKKKDEDSVLGLDVQPQNDLLGLTITDTASVYLHTQRVDSTRTYNDQYKYLGTMLDPVFGKTNASIYTNISISNNLTNLSFGINPVLDSAELVIRSLDQFIGDTTTRLTYDVYLMNEQIQTATAYYTSKDFLRSSFKVNKAGGKFKVRGDAYCLVIPLSSSIAQYILDNPSNLTNNTAFQAANKGFYITANNTPLTLPGSGSIIRFDLDDDLSGMNLYYHDGNSINAKGEKYQFTFRGTDALRLNRIEHNYAAGAKQNLYDQVMGAGTADTLKGNTDIYLNCFGGTRARVYLPYLKNFNDSQNVSISRAELILKIDEGAVPYNSNYGYPSELALIGCSADGTEELVYDQLETSDFVKYGGTYDATNKQYVFNIARQMQKIITKKITNNGFYLVNASPSVAYVARRDNRMQRVVLGGKTNVSYKAMFKVTYVKFPHDK